MPPELPRLLTDIDRDTIGALLLHIWTAFTVIRPELSIRLAPFAAWLDSPTATRLDGARATLRAAVHAGVLDLASDRDAIREVDLLGRVYQELQKPGRKKAHGEFYTPEPVARFKAEKILEGIEPGTVTDPFAGTGGLLRAAAQVLRERGTDPRTVEWRAADINPVAVSALAVNAYLWDLGHQVVIGRANTTAEPDWETRAAREQRSALEQHAVRVQTVFLLAAFSHLLVSSPAQTGYDTSPETAEPASQARQP